MSVTITVDFTDSQFKEYEDLMKRCNIGQFNEFTKAAFGLLVYALEARLNGRIIGSVTKDEKDFVELWDPIFNHLDQF